MCCLRWSLVYASVNNVFKIAVCFVGTFTSLGEWSIEKIVPMDSKKSPDKYEMDIVSDVY